MIGVGKSLASIFFFQAEDGIRDLVRSRGLGDVYKRQAIARADKASPIRLIDMFENISPPPKNAPDGAWLPCLLYTSDAADERSSVDLGGRRIIKKKKEQTRRRMRVTT